MKAVVAIKDGFYDGFRRKAGAKFQVSDKALELQEEKVPAKQWFVLATKYKAPKLEPSQRDVLNASRRESESFVALMGKMKDGVPTDGPNTLSEMNARAPQLPPVAPRSGKPEEEPT